MVVSGKTFLEQEQENPVTQLSTGGKNQIVAPSDTINTSKVLEGQKTQTTGTLEKGNWTTRDRIKESITGDEAKRDILNAATTLEEGLKTVQNKIIGAGEYVKDKVGGWLQEKMQDDIDRIQKQENEKSAAARKEQREVKKELESLSGTDKKRSDMLTVVDPYKTQPQYGPFVDYSRERLNVGSIGEVVKNVTVNNDQTMAFISNGLTTISKPVINGIDFQKTLQDAYNAITYEYANFGNLVNPEIVKQYFPAWKDASDEEINRFINECAYDVEQGKRRDISMYAENFLDLAMPDGYTSKHDAVLKLYGDEKYINYGWGAFLNGTATLEGKTQQDIVDYLSAIQIINESVQKVKENGANTQGASDFVIAKTFIDDYDGLREALDIYQKFNLTTKDLATIDAVYAANEENMKDFTSQIIYDKKVDRIDVVYDHFNDMAKTKVLAEARGDYIPLKDIQDWFMSDVYEADGKFFNKDGDEVPENETRIGVFKAWLEGLRGIGQGVDNIEKDLARISETPKDSDKYFEVSQQPMLDIINTAFRIGINFTGPGILLGPGLTQVQGKVESDTLKEFAGTEDYPTIGRIAEATYETVFGWLGDQGVKLGDMIGYTEGWDESSKEKFSETFAGLATIVFAKIKGRIEKQLGIKIKNTTVAKSIEAMKNKIKTGLKLIDENAERMKIENKKSINREAAPEEQIKSQEKMVDEMVDTETRNRKSMFIRETIRNAIPEFRKTFLEEFKKQTEESAKEGGTTSSPSLIDKLFNKALQLGEQMKAESAAEVKADIDNIQKGEVTTPEATTEIKVEEQPTPEGEQVKVEETQVEKPETTVEQAKATATAEEKATGTAKVDEKASQQTKSTIKSILSFIADVIDMGKEIKDFNQRRYKAKIAEKAEREAENKRIIDAEALSDAGLTEEQIRQMQNNPYSETLLDIINSLTKEIKDKKGRITKVKQETSLTRDEIQREVLSRGIERLQKHVDKLVNMRKLLKEMYGELEKRKNIDTSKFPDSEPLQNVLKDYGYGIEIEVDPETNAKKATVYKLEGTDASPSEMGEMKYIEDFINKQLKFEKKSEADLFKNRQWLKWNEDTYGKNGRSKALENSFRDAFNKFIEEQGDVKLLRAIDKGFSELSDGIDTLRELLNKDNTIKDNAKNKILKWDNETLNQIDEIIPGFKQLVELTKVAPEIINQGVKAKRMTQSTWQKTASVVRYMFVGGAPTLIVPKFVRNLGLAAGSAAAVLLGSALFKVSENFGLKMKHKIQGIKPDLTLYDTFVDNLKITDNEKAIYKKKINEQIKELTESAEIKTEAEFNKLIDEVAEILIERKANEIAENKLRNRGTEPEEPATPKGPDDKTPPSGGTPDLTPEEKQIIKDASAIGEKEHSPAAEKAADVVEEIKQTIEDAQTDDATAKLEERGEDVTPESIKNEIDNPKPKSILEELGLVEEGEFENKTQEINVKEVDTKLLEEAWENPDKYGVSKEELVEIEEELQRRGEQDAMAQMRAEDARDTNEDAANMAEINELDQKKANAKTPEEKAKIQKQIDEKTNKAIDQIQKKRNLESTAEAEEALLEQNNASYNRIEAGKDTSVGKFRQNSYSTLLFAEKYGMKAQKPLSRTSSIENIMENPNPKTKARLLEEKKRHTEEKIKKSKYAKNREKQIAELQKINEAIEENNKNLQALQEKIDTEKELTAKRSKATTREEKKELTKQIDENNKELEKLLDEQQKDLRDMPETEDIEAQEKEPLIKHPMKDFSPLDEYGTKEDREGISVKVDNVPDEMGIGAVLLRLYKNGEEISTDKAPVAVNKWINRIRDRIIYENDIKEGDIITHNSKGENGEIVGKDIEINMNKQGVKEVKAPEIEATDELPTPREATEKFYHASDADIEVFNMDKTKSEGNGIGLAVNLKADHPYTDKPYQYEIDGKDFKIGGSDTLLSEKVLKKICDRLGIEYNEAWTKVELPELSNIIAEESGKGNREVTDVLVQETGLDGVDTHHDYTVLWNEEKINKSYMRTKGETKTPEYKEERGDVKPTLEQGETKGEMYHVTPEDFEEFKEYGEDEYMGNDIDWNTAFGTFVTNSRPFLEDFMKISEENRGRLRGNKQWKEKVLDVDLKKVILHPANIADVFGYGRVADGILIDYLKEVGRFDLDMQKDLISLKLLDIGKEFDYDTYEWKDNYTKEEILNMPGSIHGGIKTANFEGGEEESFLFGDEAEADAKILKKKGYDAVKFLEGRKDGQNIYSYAISEPNKFLRKTPKEEPKSETKKETKVEEKKENQATQKEPEPLVKQEDNGKAYAMKGNPTSKEIFERMQYLRNKAKQNGNKISFRDRSELEFLRDRYKTKLMEEAKQEYDPSERDDLNREELGSIGGINVPTYGMTID